MFMVSVSAKLTDTFRSQNTEFSVLDLKGSYRGAKYLHETLKILPKKPDTIVIDTTSQQRHGDQSVLFIKRNKN